MSKPIDKLEFWKQRIDTAVKPHYSVYVIHEQGWNRINTAHKELIEQHIPKDAKVLDAGCAYGRSSVFFNDYTGVDFSPDFIAKAKEQYPDKEFIVANLKELPFEDNTFDWAITISIKRMVIDNLGEEEWQKMEKEIKRVAKKLLVLEYEDPTIYEVI